MSNKILFCFTLICLLSCNNKTAPDTESVVVKPAMSSELVAGQQIFEQNCVPCHGTDGTAGIGGAVNLQTLQADSLAIVQTISRGRHNMPGFGERFSGEQIQDVMAYIKTLRH